VVIKPDDGNNLAHELGHYFGLSHVHNEGMTLQGAAEILVKNLPPFLTQGLLKVQEAANQIINSIFDGDAPDKSGVPHPVTDTLPSIQVWPVDSANNPLPDKCTASLQIDVVVEKQVVPFLNVKQKHTFSFTPDRNNVMSYFQGCPQCEKFSPQQIDVMRSLIETGNRRHLLGPALRWSGWIEVPGTGITDTSVAATAFDKLILIAKGPTGKLSRNQATLKGTALDWGSSWAELEGNGNAGFAPAVTTFDKKLYVFAVGPTGLVFHNFAGNGQPFQPQWFEVPGDGLASGAAAITRFDNKLYAFVVGPTGLIFHNFAGAGQPFQSQWFEVPGKGNATGAPATTVFDNKIYVFVVGPTGRIFHNFAGPGQSFQEQWFELPGNGISITSAAGALGQYLYVFIVGSDKGVYMNWAQSGSPFNSWIEIPGVGITKAAPAVAIWNNQLPLCQRTGWTNLCELSDAKLNTF
jgi:hypothetical protein